MHSKFVRLNSAVAIGVTAALLAGCGSGGSGAPGADAPIKVMMISTVQSAALATPQGAAAAQAAVDTINASGGINGRKVEFTSCNDNLDPNTAASCARKAVSSHAAFVVQGLTNTGTHIHQVLGAAKIPNIVAYPLSSDDFTAATAVPISSGANGAYAGLAEYMGKTTKCTSVGLIVADQSTTRPLADLIANTFKQVGVKVASTAYVPATTTDFASPVAKVTGSGEDCVVMGLAPQQTALLVPIIRKTAPSVKIGVQSSMVPASVVKSLGSDAEGIIVADLALPTTVGSSAMKPFTEAMNKYAPDQVKDSQALYAWVAMQLGFAALKDPSGTSAQDVATALESVKNLDLGVVPPLSVADRISVPSMTRVFNTGVVIDVLENSKLVVKSDPAFVDVRDILQHR